MAQTHKAWQLRADEDLRFDHRNPTACGRRLARLEENRGEDFKLANYKRAVEAAALMGLDLMAIVP